MLIHDLLTDMSDLVLGRACLDCDDPGRALCATCLERLRGRVVEVPGAGPPVSAAVDYDRDGRRLVVAYKEHGNRALGPMLGVLLADAVVHRLEALGSDACIVVPVPAHRFSRRGFDALAGIVRPAVRDLRTRGVHAQIARPVGAARAYRPLKDLGRDERQRTVQGAFALRGRSRDRVAEAIAPVIVVDDVVTTGATVREMTSALATGGVDVAGAAAVAAVSRGRSASSPAPARPRPRQ